MSEKKATNNEKMEKIVSLTKRRGFIFQGSEIYGGLAGTYDFGPLGVALKNNIKNVWWRKFVEDREDMYGVDAAILMNQNVWKASGHVSGFSDPLVECKNCQSRFRVDHLPFDISDLESVKNENFVKIEDYYKEIGEEHVKVRELIEHIEFLAEKMKGSKLNSDELDLLSNLRIELGKKADKRLESASIKIALAGFWLDEIKESPKYTGFVTQIFLNRYVNCPVCKKRDWETPRQFNMMFKTNVGANIDDSSVSYLRPETAQGMFVNYKNVLDSLHPKLPFGLAQIGKAFRNEIAPRDFIFRLRELEQMEIEYFVNPNVAGEWERVFDSFRVAMHDFTKEIGLDPKSVHELEVADGDRAHYSKRTIDFEFDFPFGKKELYGLAYRTDFDLRQHSTASGVDLSYFDEETKQRFIPHCIEPSFGVERTVLAVLSNAYSEEEITSENDKGEKTSETRVFLKIAPSIAPIKVAVFPLLKNKPALIDKAREVYAMLKKELAKVGIHGIEFDDNGNIGKRYRRQDEIGTPYCVTVDFDTIEKETGVTVRNRDTGKQERVAIADLIATMKFS